MVNTPLFPHPAPQLFLNENLPVEELYPVKQMQCPPSNFSPDFGMGTLPVFIVLDVMKEEYTIIPSNTALLEAIAALRFNNVVAGFEEYLNLKILVPGSTLAKAPFPGAEVRLGNTFKLA